MLVIPNVSKTSFLILGIVWTIIALFSIYSNAPFLLFLVLTLWSFLFVCVIDNLIDNIALFCFLISFFVFLLGREVAFEYFSVERYYLYLSDFNSTAYLCVLISLIGIVIGDIIWRSHHHGNNLPKIIHYSGQFQSISKYYFYFCFIFQIISSIIRIRFVSNVGYLASYTDEFIDSGVPAFVSYVAAFSNIAFCFFLATKPSKNNALLPMVLYEAYGIMSLLTGKRFPFVAVNLVLLIYCLLRYKDEKEWFSKRLGILIILIIPILLVFLSVWDNYRLNRSISIVSLFSTIISFFDSQGGSINNINRVLYFKQQLGDLKLTSFDSTRTLLFENIIMRKVFGVKIYEGNSYEHAMYGHSLAHRLSYLTYGNGYLEGKGVGSCYIAELFYDFGYFGVLIGNIIYGYLLKAVSKISFSSFIKDGILLAVVYSLLLAPRSGFDSFIGNVFSLYSCLGIVMMFIIARVWNKRKIRG